MILRERRSLSRSFGLVEHASKCYCEFSLAPEMPFEPYYTFKGWFLGPNFLSNGALNLLVTHIGIFAENLVGLGFL